MILWNGIYSVILAWTYNIWCSLGRFDTGWYSRQSVFCRHSTVNKSTKWRDWWYIKSIWFLLIVKTKKRISPNWMRFFSFILFSLWSVVLLTARKSPLGPEHRCYCPPDCISGYWWCRHHASFYSQHL